ncbi:MAG: tRNA threonylcarbamoyladenosine biosynthesis protein TsaB [Chloroflexota bacterium]|nr:tRNA threonylcarbamoyladenosine biosynthesis protein TsaB [Chloroflexota bacterium]
MANQPILAIDTSGMAASVAVYSGHVLAEVSWQSGRRHSAELLPTIDTALDLARVARSELTAVAVAVGPGSYSGLRVGVSTAMALGLGLGIDVAQVPTLEVIAWAHLGDDERRKVRAAIDVGRGRYASARFSHHHGRIEQETQIAAGTAAELAAMAQSEDALLVIDLDPEARATLQTACDAGLRLAAPAAATRRAGFLAELAVGRIERGEATNGVVEPIYLGS